MSLLNPGFIAWSVCESSRIERHNQVQLSAGLVGVSCKHPVGCSMSTAWAWLSVARFPAVSARAWKQLWRSKARTSPSSVTSRCLWMKHVWVVTKSKLRREMERVWCYTHKENRRQSALISILDAVKQTTCSILLPAKAQEYRQGDHLNHRHDLKGSWMLQTQKKDPCFPVQLSHRPSRSKLLFPLNPDDIQRILRCSSTSTWPGVAKNWCLFYLKSGSLSLCRCNFDDLGPSHQDERAPQIKVVTQAVEKYKLQKMFDSCIPDMDGIFPCKHKHTHCQLYLGMFDRVLAACMPPSDHHVHTRFQMDLMAKVK